MKHRAQGLPDLGEALQGVNIPLLVQEQVRLPEDGEVCMTAGVHHLAVEGEVIEGEAMEEEGDEEEWEVTGTVVVAEVEEELANIKPAGRHHCPTYCSRNVRISGPSCSWRLSTIEFYSKNKRSF